MNAHRNVVPDDAQDLRTRFEQVAPVIEVDPVPVVRRGRRRRAATRAGGALGAVAAVAVAVALITRVGGDGPGPAASPPPPEPTGAVSLHITPAVVEPGGVVTAVLVANQDNDFTYGVAVDVQRWTGQEWRPAGEAVMCLVEWSCISTVVDRIDAVEDIGLGAPLGVPGAPTVLSTAGLADGWYRLVHREVHDVNSATGVFEVRSDAPAAPPQPDRDEVRLTLDPVLIPPAGGVAQVMPLVPAGPDGTLTAEDIIAVDASLDPTVRIERWDGTAWLEVAEAPGLERESDDVAWSTPVPIPPLAEGSYRVVRDRAGEPAPWGVFAVVDGAPALPQYEPVDQWTPEATPDPGAEDVFAPDHPRCQELPGRCLLEAWWRDVVAEAGIERGGGDHDLGLVLTDSVRMAGQRYLMLTLFPAGLDLHGSPVLTVESTRQVGESTIEAGRWGDGADGRRLTCGSFILQTSSTDLSPDEIDHVANLLADALQDCPADVDALAARYPDYPPLP